MIEGMFSALFRFARSGLALALLVCVPVAWAQPPASSIAVIYPDIAEPYRSLFAKIIGGIEEKAGGKVVPVVIGAEVDAGTLNDTLRRNGVKVAIALGRQGMKAAELVDRSIGVVVGGVLPAQYSEVRSMQINILSPAPALLFSRLKAMMPGVKRVFLVYDPRQSAWLMRLAKEAAQAQGLELETREAEDLRGAMRAYQEIFASADQRRDALWLPQDSISVEESSVLPLVLQESWERSFVVFSSSIGHVKRGALFAMYPDNAELGRGLAISALDLLAAGGRGTFSMVPLREAEFAVNLRTARHLGIDPGRARGIGLTYPER